MMAAPLAGTLAAIPHVHAWLDKIGERPAVKQGMAVP